MPATKEWQNFGTVGYRYQRVVIDDDQSHRIRVLNGFNGFCGVIVPGGGGIEPAGPRLQIAIPGDSYVQGAGAASEPGLVGAGGICGYLSLLLGAEVLNFGQGTTGYVAEGVGGNRSKFGSTERLAKLAEWDPDVIIVFGGGNDTSETPSTVVTAANALWNAIAAAHPTAKLFVVGIQSPDLFSASGMDALNDALRVAALANANVDLWIDMREPEYWVTDATEGLFITTEFPASIHPGKAGAMNIALRMIVKIAMEAMT
jgi:lysophospholipase L1-like esterase